jgi:hypothetical protein
VSDGPYREALVQEKRYDVVIIASKLFDMYGPSDQARAVAGSLSSTEVFEAVRVGNITSEQGAQLLWMKRERDRELMPWPVRLAEFLFGSRRWF